MPAKNESIPLSSVDGLLKAMLVISRTVDHILENRAVEASVYHRYSSSKVQILRLLGQRGAQTSTQVARFLGVSKPAVSQIVNTMVRSKLVVRRPAKEDRREVHLLLTKKGRDTFQTVRKQQRHFVRGAIREMPKGSIDRWTRLLRDLSGALARSDKDFKHYCLQCGAHDEGTCILSGGSAQCNFLSHVGPVA